MSPVSFVVGFVFALSLTAAFVGVTVTPSVLVLSWTYVDLRSFLLSRSPARIMSACFC